MTDKEFQKAQFGVGEVDGATIEFAHEAPAGVEHAMIEIQQMGQVGAAVGAGGSLELVAAQHLCHAHHHLGEVERLGDVVVSTVF
ncbi:hypothetical protein RAZWK3B_15048 [Roseobacter sp. AzwK-3b]|nr:hypothetical protein RAZWK3B_15048 [Roseobacter sp. AzwK-3b]